jgi:rare lipoprotein A
MAITQKKSNVNPNASLQFWLLVGASCIALTGVLVTLSTRPVQADALLPRTAATAPSTISAGATPLSAEPQQATGKKRHNIFRGIASWYGSVFNGRKTASGERFNMNAMTACHPTLPFGTKVRVVNTTNHRSVVVRITDRGDDLGGRVIDLSRAAAQELRMTGAGLAPVSIEVLSLGQTHPGQ